MAKDFFDRFACARDAFAEASDALGLDVAALCFEEDPRLDRTEFTQPAILTAEVAMTRALAELGLAPAWFGGHSLGEYTALCAAGVLPLGEAARLANEVERLEERPYIQRQPGGWQVRGRAHFRDAAATAGSGADPICDPVLDAVEPQPVPVAAPAIRGRDRV